MTSTFKLVIFFVPEILVLIIKIRLSKFSILVVVHAVTFLGFDILVFEL